MANVRWSGCALHQELCVRVNGVDSGLMGLDIEAVFGGRSCDLGEEPSRIPDSIMLPKCDSIEHLREVLNWLGWELNMIGHRRGGGRELNLIGQEGEGSGREWKGR